MGPYNLHKYDTFTPLSINWNFQDSYQMVMSEFDYFDFYLQIHQNK